MCSGFSLITSGAIYDGMESTLIVEPFLIYLINNPGILIHIVSPYVVSSISISIDKRDYYPLLLISNDLIDKYNTNIGIGNYRDWLLLMDVSPSNDRIHHGWRCFIVNFSISSLNSLNVFSYLSNNNFKYIPQIRIIISYWLLGCTTH